VNPFARSPTYNFRYIDKPVTGRYRLPKWQRAQRPEQQDTLGGRRLLFNKTGCYLSAPCHLCDRQELLGRDARVGLRIRDAIRRAHITLADELDIREIA
jgi:hypothetical protein